MYHLKAYFQIHRATCAGVWYETETAHKLIISYLLVVAEQMKPGNRIFKENSKYIQVNATVTPVDLYPRIFGEKKV